MCGQDGRGEGLANMHRELEKCERALTEYLDMKKNVFPRFEKSAKLANRQSLALDRESKREREREATFGVISQLRSDALN